MNNQEVIATLNSLLQTTKDGAKETHPVVPGAAKCGIGV
jgi:hypothetical protein